MSPKKPRSGNTPLVLPEIEIPNSGPTFYPIPPDTTGINIAARDLYPRDGLKLIIDPWSNMSRGDSYRVKLDNQPVVGDIIDTDEQVDQEVVCFIPPLLLVDGPFNLSYEVIRVGNPTPENSLATPIYVKVEYAPPGGPDLDAGTPGHSELHLSIPPEFLPPGGVVDKDAAAAGIPVTIEPYPKMFEGDRIKLSWGGEFVWRTVEDFEVGTPIVIIVDEATILAADDTDTNGLVVAFILYDVVDNASTWSAGVRVVVDTGSSRLIGPLIKEAVNMVLDMDRLGEADLTFQVFTFGGEFAVGDQIEMRLSGLTASGERVDKTYPPEVITNAAGITEFTRPSTEVRALAGGIHATFFYRLIKADGSDDLFSKTFSPKVIGRSTILAAPIAYDEIAGTLDPDLPNTRVDIPWDDGMAQGNVIMLVWEGTTANGIPYAPDLPLHPITDNEVGKTIPISVDGVHLKAIEDGTLELYYWLLDNEINRAAIRHESLHAGPFRIGPFVAELPAPVVQYESGGVLDPDDVPLTGTLLTVLQYTGQIEKDVVHILWWGSITGRYRDQITLNSVTDKIDVPFTIPKTLVEGNRGGTVQAMYWVKRANGHVSPSAILLMSIGAAMNLLAPSVKQASGTAPDQQLNPVAVTTELTVEIPDYNILPGDQVSVTWTGSAGEGSYTTVPQALSTDREIPLPVSLIAYNLDKPVTVTYRVTRNGDESDPSASLYLMVQRLAESDLPKPKILEAANNGEGSELDLNAISGDGICQLTIWPHIAPDQDVWLRLKGTKADGTVPYDLTIWNPPPRGPRASQLWLDQGYYDTPIDYSYLKDLKDGSTLTIEFKADLSQTTDEANATTFPLRTYTIRAVALDAPNITDIRDSKRSVIDKITADTSVTVEGTGSSGQQIQLMDGSNNIGPVINIPAPGTTWRATLTGLTVRAYSLKARALYGTGIPDSQAKTFIVTTASIPTLDSVKDDKGAEINEGDFTTSLLIDVDGTASRDQEVEIYDGNGASAELKGTTKADPVTGRWSLPDIAVTPKAHRFYAKALYNTGGTVYSNVRTFTVTDLVNPTLTDISDSKGSVVDGSTVENSVTVTGTGSRGQQIQLMDGTNNIGSPFRVPDNSTTWSTPLNNLTTRAYNIKAKALYGNGLPESATKTFNVLASAPPTITSVNESTTPSIPNGGVTAATSVILTGSATPGLSIDLFDNLTSLKGTFVATGGTWTTTPPIAVTDGAHSFTAKAKYGSEPVSAAWTFTVITLTDQNKPYIQQAENNGTGATLDLGTFAGDATVKVSPWPGIKAGQRVWLRCLGKKANNADHIITLYTASAVVPAEERDGLSKNIPRAQLEQLGDNTSLTVELKIKFNGSSVEDAATVFPLRTYTVRAALELRAPSVKQATGTAPTQQLNPMAATTALTVEIPEYGIQPGDQVSVTWTGSAGGGSHTTQVQVLPSSREITLPVSVIAYNLGKPVTVTYRVTRNGNESDPSAPLNLTVQRFTENDLLGSKPKLLQAANNGEGSELDLNTLSADAKCRLTIWPHLASGQDIWLRLKGTKADGTVPYDLTIWNPPPRGPATSQSWLDAGFYDTTVPYSYLKDLKDGSTLTIEFKADLSQTTNEANATTFPLRTYTVRAIALIAPTLDSVKDPNIEIPDGTTTTSTSLKLSGQASKGLKVEIFEGSGTTAQSKGQATAETTTGIWTHPITVDPGDRRLYAKSLYHSSNVYSNVRTLKVSSPFSVGPATVAINGNGDYHVFLHPEWEHVGQLLPHHIYQIPVTGGTGAYSYQIIASNPVRVVNVNENGQVYPGRSAGTATIRVSDQGGNWADIQFTVTWVRQWEQAAWSVTKTQADQHVRNKGLTLPNRPDLGNFYNAFAVYGANVCDVVGITNSGPGHATCWFWEEALGDSGKWWYRNLGNGTEAQIGLAAAINSIGWRRSG